MGAAPSRVAPYVVENDPINEVLGALAKDIICSHILPKLDNVGRVVRSVPGTRGIVPHAMPRAACFWNGAPDGSWDARSVWWMGTCAPRCNGG